MSIPVLKAYDLILFDLDGTLIDSLEDIVSATTAFAESRKVVAPSQEQVCLAIGHGARYLLDKLFGIFSLSESGQDAAYQDFLSIYEDLPVRPDCMIPGARQFLEVCKEQNKNCVLLTNKPQAPTKKILDELNLNQYFEHVSCPENSVHVKPDPLAVQHWLKLFSVDAEQCLFFGDSEADFASGHGAGVHTIGLKAGYGPKPKHQPKDWIGDYLELME